ncbi:hypothetical protein L202_07101 [Cryptococcus amylolentus CBS 6039]|uniref:Solute carrier family 40 member n=1 Tax=Cryptococcus amylolentus CBS 6039 TaxID=1295533 RepID=A0A1E3HH90_9TREE|nr:hypothetical protein L202_07101 [Cryptococcus amylolentus CBS 6039]ODN74781.1 hypothetical protein L202_07101 [Cryptococcus amylolentus CBS 6039]
MTHPARAPSLAGAVLYLTVLSFSGQMITYLLSSGFTSSQVGAVRTLSVAFEVGATFVAPCLISMIGPVRAALWSGNWQLFSLLAGSFVFASYSEQPFVAASGLVVGTILSRLGLRTFDLCTQIIVQEEVEPEVRGIFSSIESAWQNAFELLSYTSTIIFFRPDQFHYPVWLSVGAVATAVLLFSNFVWHRRGHLLHPEKMAGICGCHERWGNVG